MDRVGRLLTGGIFSNVGALSTDLNLFFVQATIIISICRVLSLVGYYLKQPRVVFEIIGGILLGPSALGKDSYFAQVLFPDSSIPYLSLVADIGLTLYLFLVGLELDLKLLATHGKKAGVIAIMGMAIPFVLGIIISQTMLDTLQPGSNVSFTSFFVFIGTAMSITAFPVLARILKEGGLIYTKAGAMTMGAAALNDAIAWCLLALAISIASAGDMNTAGYIFACMVAMTLVLLFIVSPILDQIVVYVEALDSPAMSSNLFALTICLLFICAWTTALIGLDSIFGAFLFGLVIPRDSHLFKECNERIEELVVTFTLPLYFALSGLNTDVTTINTGQQIAMIVLVCFCATIGKFVGAGGAAYLSGMTVRESSVVAVLMNTRGLVELIVLNTGLQAGILNTQTFSVMVIMCLFTTFITNPLVLWIYPERLREHVRTKTVEDVAAVAAFSAIAEQLSDYDQNSAFSNKLNEKQCNHIGIVVDSLHQMQYWINVVNRLVPCNINTTFGVTLMHFLEPTNTDKDELLGLNAEGRLIRVDEETTDFQTALALAHDPLAKKAEMLPISMFCKTMDIGVNAFRIEGDPVEFPIELKNLSKQNEVSLLYLPWRGNSHYAQKLFWSSIQIITNASIALMVPMKSYAAFRSAINSTEGIELTTTSPAMTSRNRRNSVYNAITATSVIANHRNIIHIVAILTGQHTDLIILGILLRYTENSLHHIHIILPQDHTTYPEMNQQALKRFKQCICLDTNQQNIVEFVGCEAISNDYHGLVEVINNYEYDMILCGFILPPIIASEPMFHNNHPDSAVSRGRTNTLFTDAMNDFFSTHSPLPSSTPPSSSDTIQEQRLNVGMPAQCAFSSLLHPELGMLGNALYEAGTATTRQHANNNKPVMMFVIHDPLNIAHRRGTFVSEQTNN